MIESKVLFNKWKEEEKVSYSFWCQRNNFVHYSIFQAATWFLLDANQWLKNIIYVFFSSTLKILESYKIKLEKTKELNLIVCTSKI